MAKISKLVLYFQNHEAEQLKMARCTRGEVEKYYKDNVEWLKIWAIHYPNDIAIHQGQARAQADFLGYHYVFTFPKTY